eukprot:UC1_evm3s1885
MSTSESQVVAQLQTADTVEAVTVTVAADTAEGEATTAITTTSSSSSGNGSTSATLVEAAAEKEEKETPVASAAVADTAAAAAAEEEEEEEEREEVVAGKEVAEEVEVEVEVEGGGGVSKSDYGNSSAADAIDAPSQSLYASVFGDGSESESEDDGEGSGFGGFGDQELKADQAAMAPDVQEKLKALDAVAAGGGRGTSSSSGRKSSKSKGHRKRSSEEETTEREDSDGGDGGTAAVAAGSSGGDRSGGDDPWSRAGKSKRSKLDDNKTYEKECGLVLNAMKRAKRKDDEAFRARKPALNKLTILPKVVSQLRKQDLLATFVHQGLYFTLSDWLRPLPDRSLPSETVRTAMIDIITKLPPMTEDFVRDHLMESEIGKVCMLLYRSKEETPANKTKLRKVMDAWNRVIINRSADYKQSSEVLRRRIIGEAKNSADRVKRVQIAKARKSEKMSQLRPGEHGFVMRARVPMQAERTFVEGGGLLQDTHRPTQPRARDDEAMEVGARSNARRRTHHEEMLARFQSKKRMKKTPTGR